MPQSNQCSAGEGVKDGNGARGQRDRPKKGSGESKHDDNRAVHKDCKRGGFESRMQLSEDWGAVTMPGEGNRKPRGIEECSRYPAVSGEHHGDSDERSRAGTK